MLENLQVAIPLGIFLAFTIGPVFFVLLETSATKGFRAGLMFDLGVIFADILFIIIAFYSTTRIVEKVKNDPNLLIFGGVVLMMYGAISYIKILRSFKKIVREHYSVTVKKQYGQLFIKGFLLNFINIGVLAGWIGIIIIANTVSENENQVIGFLVVVLLSYLMVDLVKIYAAKHLRSKLTPRVTIRIKRFISIIIFIFGAFLLVEGLFPEVKERTQERLEDINPIKKSNPN